MSDDTQSVEIVARIVAAYVANNRMMAQELPDLIQAVHEMVRTLTNGTGSAEALKPAVAIKRSVTDDHIVCLEDGLKFKSLKRHLRTSYDMTPEQYRTKWGLPHDYPMVAPNYARARSDLAKKMGLGTRREK